MLSFFAAFPSFALDVKSCHLDFPASSSLVALTFRGTFGGRGGPSPTLLGSFLASFAKAGLISAAADMTLELAGRDCGDKEPGIASALRFRVSLLLEIGLMSFAVRDSVVAYDLNETMYMGFVEEPVIAVIRAG